MKKLKTKVTNIMFKIIFTLSLIEFSLFFTSKNSVFAASNITGMVTDPKSSSPDSGLTNIANPILAAIKIIVFGVVVGLVINDGIKLLTTVDNSEKANLKRKLLYYIIGGILVFAPIYVVEMLSTTSEMFN